MPGELKCWHCRCLVTAAAQAHGNEAYQRRCLRFLDIRPFFPGTHGPLCLFHAIVALGNGPDAIAAEIARRSAS